MKRFRRCALALTLLMCATLVVADAPGSAADAPPLQPISFDAAIQPPALTAPVALAVDLTTGVQLYAQNADTPAPPASTMKVVTALLARQLLPLDTQVEVKQQDLLDPTIYSTMGLQAGDVVSVADLLRGLLLPSGDDAGLALARVAGEQLGASEDGAVGRFVDELNAYAQRIGMTNSHFVNPVGIDDPNELATARDLMRAVKLLLDDQFLSQTVGAAQASAHVSGPNARDIPLTNTNELLTQRDDVFGVKTGTETTAGQCLILGFWRGDDQIITIVLGSQDRYADTQALMDALDASYRWVALGVGAQSLGASDELAAQGLTFAVRRTVLLTQEQAGTLTYDIDLAATSNDPDQRGVVNFRLGARVVARLPVYSGMPR